MVMVRLAGAFVAGRLAGELHGRNPVFVDQHLDRAIHGGDAEAGLVTLGLIEHLIGAERTVLGGEDVTNRPALARITLPHP